MKNICILGATGSIGQQTLDVIRKQKDKFKLIAVSANKSVDQIIQIIEEFYPSYVSMMDEDSAKIVKQYCGDKKLNIEVLYGMDGLTAIATLTEVHTVVTSVVGMIGLVPTLAAIEAGKDIALANKETLVVAGALVNDLVKKNKVRLLPVDSEHSAIFQCLQGAGENDPSKLILTGSGGPFRGKDRNALRDVTVEQALKHPRWEMGKKISIDSSTLMNKGLEVIEAHWLFRIPYEKIEVVIHPQSIIHSMIEYDDGSVIAQMSTTDMRLPIQYALNFPSRKDKVISPLNFYSMPALTFEKPDMDTFRCLRLAYEAGKAGGIMPAILNGANEVAVELFLKKKITYLQIFDILEECMGFFTNVSNPALENILEADYKVRNFVQNKY